MSRKENKNYFRGFQVWSVTKSQSPEGRSRSQPFDCEGHVSRNHALRVEVLLEEASVVSLKLLKPKVLKSLIVIDHEGGHASVDRELQGKALQEKTNIEELKLPKPKEMKC
jgi:hypothetical protein